MDNKNYVWVANKYEKGTSIVFRAIRKKKKKKSEHTSKSSVLIQNTHLLSK